MFFAKMSIVENGQFYRFLAKIRQISRNYLPKRKKQGVGRIDKIQSVSGLHLKFHFGSNVPVTTLNTKAALRKLLKYISLSLKSSNFS